MKRITLIYAWLFCLALSVAAQEKVVKLKIVQTNEYIRARLPFHS